MSDSFSIQIDSWQHGSAIPAKFAFGQPGIDGPFATSDNISPKITWRNAPSQTQSFALICHDPDVPSSPEDVNQEGRTVPASLPRVSFYHWVLVDIPATTTELAEGEGGSGVVAKGKPTGVVTNGITGQNNYTDWFAGDADMEGTYGGYDGPCPPWNDSIVHHYHFTIYALDVPSLNLTENFNGPDAVEAIKDHILAEANYTGTYSMNPDVKA